MITIRDYQESDAREVGCLIAQSTSVICVAATVFAMLSWDIKNQPVAHQLEF